MKKKIIMLILTIMTINITGCSLPEKHTTTTITIHHNATEPPIQTQEPQYQTEPPVETQTPEPTPTEKPKKRTVGGIQSKKERPGIYTISWLKFKKASQYQTEICEHKNFKRYTSRHNLKEVSIDIYTRSGKQTYIRIRALVKGKYTPWSDIYNVRTGKAVKR